MQQGRAIIVMGVSGGGKTTIAEALAAHLACPFLEGDDFHSPAARAKMTAGTPLTDDDRWEWLDRLGRATGETMRQQGACVTTCSALKQVYRDRLEKAAGTELIFVWPNAPFEVIERRLKQRKGHYMPASLLESQFAILEPPQGPRVFAVDASAQTGEMVANVLKLFPAAGEV
jgi:gluconokinase